MHNRPMPSAPRTATPGPRPNPTLRERFTAMRNVPPFLRQIWAASPALSITSLGLRVVRAFLPILMLYVGRLIIVEALRMVVLVLEFDFLGGAWRSGLLHPLLWMLAIEFALDIASDLLGRLVSYAETLLSELFTNATSIRLMEHAATL